MRRINGIIASSALVLGMSAFANQADNAPLNPLSLVKMNRFTVSETEGFHNCFWIGPTLHENNNIAWPDEGAVYWSSKFILPKDAAYLELDGAYPKARYFSYHTYDIKTQPLDVVKDTDLVPYVGHNPFTTADAKEPAGRYRLKVVAAAKPATAADREPNTIYLGQAELRNTDLPLIWRTYVPAAGTDYSGDAGMPEVTLVMKDGQRLSGKAMCDAVGSADVGSPERKVPSVIANPDVYQSLLSAPNTPAGFPALENVEWLKFWGAPVLLTRYIPDRIMLEQLLAGANAGKVAKQSGFYANIDNEYISTYVSEAFGDVVVIKGRLPTTPASGWDVASNSYDLRYWSLCTNETLATTRYHDCVYDSNMVLDDERNFTVVISKEANRPSNATESCGVNWLDFGASGDGAGNNDISMLIIRNMVGENFPHSIQNISSPTAVKQDMAEYFPQATYTNKADFEALGCKL